jgi:hypothetical protein
MSVSGGVSGSLSVRQILGGFCLGFGVATYLFGAMAVVWLRHTFVIGVNNVWLVGFIMLLPALLMLIGVIAIWKGRRSYE